MRKTGFLIVLLMIQIHAISQDGKLAPEHYIDSLKNSLPGLKVLDRIKTLNKIASALAPISFDSSMNYASQTLRLATQNTWPFEIGVAKANIGNAYYYKLDLRNALLSYLSALKILEIFKPSKELGDLYLQLGHINYYMKRSDKAASFYHKALGAFMISGNERLSWQVHISLSMNYLEDLQYDSSFVYSRKLLADAKRLQDRKLEAYALVIIGVNYMGQNGDSEFEQKVLGQFNLALEIARTLGDEELIAICHQDIGDYYLWYEFDKNSALARFHYLESYKAAVKARILYLQAMALSFLADCDIRQGKYKQAEANLYLGKTKLDSCFLSLDKIKPGGPILSLGKIYDFRKTQAERTERKGLYYKLYTLSIARGEYEKAVKQLASYYEFNQQSGQQSQEFDLMMVESDNEKADQRIRILSQENELKQLKLSRARLLFAGIGAGAMIISLFVLLFFQRKRMYAEQKSVLMEQRLLRAQMNPHFLFNSLASIQNYIINEKTDQATLYLSRFSQLVRNVLDNSAEEYVSLENEVDAIQNYLELQKVRYAGKFDYRMTVDERIDPESTLIPPMLAQPFIENAIEHGIKHKETRGNIDIRFLLEDGLIRFEVEDDGVGRNRAREIESRQQRNHRSMSTAITRDRLLAMNKKLKRKKIRMEIIDLKDEAGVGCGTRVTFGIPVGRSR